MNELNAILAKADRGEVLTKDERAVLYADQCASIQKKIRGAMDTERAKHDNPVRYSQGDHNALGAVVDYLVLEMLKISLAHAGKREEVREALKEYVEQEVGLLMRFVTAQAKTVDRLSRTVDALLAAKGKTAPRQDRKRA